MTEQQAAELIRYVKYILYVLAFIGGMLMGKK